MLGSSLPWKFCAWVAAVVLVAAVLLGSPAARTAAIDILQDDGGLAITDVVAEFGYSSTLVTNAYAGEGHANIVPWRWDALASVRIDGVDYQAVTYWSNESTPYGDGLVVVGHRRIGDAWTFHLYNGTKGLPHLGFHTDDRHYAVNLGLDEEGYLHLHYGPAYNRLGYRRSTAPLSQWDGRLTEPLSMLGTHEDVVVYPSFANDRQRRLYFVFRNGVSGQANTHLYMYDARSKAWKSPPGLIQGLLFEGVSTTPQASIYHGAPVFDDDFGSGGYMHFVFNLRNTNDQPYDIGYVRFDGTNWSRVDGGRQTMPVTVHNYYRVEEIGPTEGLVDFRPYDVDGDGHLHYTYLKRDEYGVRQGYYGYYNGTSWIVRQITSDGRIQPGAAQNLGMPGIAIDRDTNTVYLFHMYIPLGWDITLWRSEPGDYSTWTRRVIYGENPGYFEATYDRWQWQANKRLHFPVTHYYGADPEGHAIVLLEWPERAIGPVPDPGREPGDFHRLALPFIVARAVPESPALDQLHEPASNGSSLDAPTDALPLLGPGQGTMGGPWLMPLPALVLVEGRSEPVWPLQGGILRLLLQRYLFAGAAVIAVGLLIGVVLSREGLHDR